MLRLSGVQVLVARSGAQRSVPLQRSPRVQAAGWRVRERAQAVGWRERERAHAQAEAEGTPQTPPD